ncbi:acetyl esterase [Enhydrobacter aerosaccus]|uniref:Acetyl esterase n=1 Tax=Enhydrobacter aerosaccus TaxID=225324 RepID=A0A1T4TFH2_9HYPH|nr:alpha/beta hydrolase [Enhydrobacter aerosaccus]SKA39233.1 acetyl esterase [Enhydrobacter aerosaccus]
MQWKEIARRLQGRFANIALRMPISWVHLVAGPPVVVDGRTLDSRTQWFLKLLALSGQRPLSMLGVAKARAEVDTFMAVMGGRAAPVGEIVDRIIPAAAGPLRLRLYRPAGSVARLLPTILFFHGGGFVIGSLEGYDLACRYFCARSGCAVLAVDYRLAPEHKFPAGIEDGLAAFRWLAAEGPTCGLDPARIILAGESAGGTIAAVVAQEVRGAPQMPCLQWLIYPAMDFEEERTSHVSCGSGFLLTRPDLEWFRDLYLDGLGQVSDPRVSPLRAGDLSGLPPALVFTAGFDPLRDEGQAYADRLTAAGVRTIHREFDSLIHGFVCMRGALPAAARAMDDMVAGLRHELARLGR